MSPALAGRFLTTGPPGKSSSIFRELKKKNNFIYLFIYFWLCWVFVAACSLSLVVASGGYSVVPASHCSGISSCGAGAQGGQASVVVAPRV